MCAAIHTDVYYSRHRSHSFYILKTPSMPAGESLPRQPRRHVGSTPLAKNLDLQCLQAQAWEVEEVVEEGVDAVD